MGREALYRYVVTGGAAACLLAPHACDSSFSDCLVRCRGPAILAWPRLYNVPQVVCQRAGGRAPLLGATQMDQGTPIFALC